jgi:hypothetical protein
MHAAWGVGLGGTYLVLNTAAAVLDELPKTLVGLLFLEP